MDLLATARFHITVVRGSALPAANPDGLPEVAFVGRSNAGKSSCINLLCNRRRLAFSSRTPGRTQALNYFAVGPADTTLGYLVDTPGYGYAAAGQENKKAWQALAGTYMRRGPPLAAVALMLDIRRGITERDDDLLSWIPPTLPLVIVLTKADKLTTTHRRTTHQSVLRDPRVARRTGPTHIVALSTLSRSGLEELKTIISQCVVMPQGADPSAPLPPTPSLPDSAPPDSAPLDSGHPDSSSLDSSPLDSGPTDSALLPPALDPSPARPDR